MTKLRKVEVEQKLFNPVDKICSSQGNEPVRYIIHTIEKPFTETTMKSLQRVFSDENEISAFRNELKTVFHRKMLEAKYFSCKVRENKAVRLFWQKI